MKYSQQGKGPFHLQEELSKSTENYFAFVYMPLNLRIPTNTNLYFATSICHICYFYLSNYGAEVLLSLIFHKTVTKIRLCHKYELFLTQNKENITLNHNEERIAIIVDNIWSKDLCSHTYSAFNPHAELAKLLFRGYTKMVYVPKVSPLGKFFEASNKRVRGTKSKW